MKKGDFLKSIMNKISSRTKMTNIEDKAENTEKIPQKLTGSCRVCNNLNSTFTYVGSQHFSRKLDLYIGTQVFKIPNPMKLYKCDSCAADYELNSLLNKYNAKPIN